MGKVRAPSLSHKRPHSPDAADERAVTSSPPSASASSSGSAPITGVVVAFVCSEDQPDQVFRHSRLRFDKLFVAVPQPDGSCTLITILDSHWKARPLLRQQLHVGGAADRTWTAFIGFTFTFTLLGGGGTDASHTRNNAVRASYSVRANSQVTRLDAIPARLPELFLMRQDIPVGTSNQVFGRNFLVMTDVDRAAEDYEDQMAAQIANGGTINCPVLAFAYGEHLHLAAPIAATLQFHCKGRHLRLCELVVDTLCDTAAPVHRRLLALISCNFQQHATDGPVLDALHEAAVLMVAPASPALPPVLLMQALQGRTVVMCEPALKLPPQQLNATWPHAEVVPRNIATACSVCQEEAPPNQPSTVCTHPGCPAAAAGEETVSTCLFVDVLSPRVGNDYDGIYTTMSLHLARQLFHDLPPYTTAAGEVDVAKMQQQAVECSVNLQRGAVAAVAAVHHGR